MPGTEKICVRCAGTFHCQPENITECQCFDLDLNEETRDFISQQYTDCLCSNCLYAIKKEFAVEIKQRSE